MDAMDAVNIHSGIYLYLAVV
eukprot:COSAG05_NODE_30223_length_103_cov_398.000000_1_plen_20_part_10